MTDSVYFVLNVGILALSTLAAMWIIGDRFMKRPRRDDDLLLLLMMIGFILTAIPALQGSASSARTTTGAMGYVLVAASALWMAFRTRRRNSSP